MTKNDNELYFLNDQYDDLLVSQFLNKINHQLYSTALRQEAVMQNITCYSGTMSDFKSDWDKNWEIGLPYKAYVARINFRLFYIYNEKKFLRKYGYGKVIPLLTIMKDHEVFAKSPVVYIDKYVVMEVSFMIYPNRTYVIIKPAPNEGISIQKMTEFINNDVKWSVVLNQKTDYYYTYKSRTSLFNGTKIDLNHFVDKVLYNKEDKTNNWDIYMSIVPNEPNLLTHSIANIITENGVKYFNISQTFKDYVFNSVSNIKVYAINSYRRSGYGKFISNGNNLPIIQIPFAKNPIPPECIMVWKYDKLTDSTVTKLTNSIVHHYPNVYDLRGMWNGIDDLFIEWFENMPPLMEFDNNLEKYLDCYGSDYASMILNKTAAQPVLEYSPLLSFVYDYDDYQTSPYFGDIRAYKLSKLTPLLHDNPIRYHAFMDYIYTKIQKKSTMTYTITSHPQIFSRSLMDNRNECFDNSSLMKNFSEPMTYIKIYNRNQIDSSCYVYVDGKRIPIEYVMTIGYNTYIYFAKRYITNQSKIVLDVSNIPDMKQVSGALFFNKLNSYSIFDNADDFKYVTGADLLFYRAYNSEFIDASNFSYRISLDTYYINHESFRENFLGDQYLVTSDLDIFSPINADLFVLQPEQTQITLSNKDFYKKIDIKRFTLAVNNPKLLNHKIIAVRTDIYQSKYIEDGRGMEVTIDVFKGKPDASRFRVFAGGILLNKDQFTVDIPPTYNDPVTVHIRNFVFDSRYDVLVEYIPFDEDIIYEGIPTSEMYKDGLLYLDKLSNKPLNLRLCRIYINGHRISDSDIKYTGINDIYKINNYYGEYITIYQQRTDRDPYEYEIAKDNMVLNSVARIDNTFSTFIGSNIN